METRNPGEHGDTGMGEVHSHLSQPDKGAGMSGSPTAGGDGGYGGRPEPQERAGQTGSNTPNRAGAAIGEAKDQAEDALHQARAKADNLRDRAEETVDEARSRANQAIDRAESQIEERTGGISMIRDNALPALGIAFAVGYLAAGSRAKKRGRVMNMATTQLRGAIMAGISAAVARELRSVLAEQGGSIGSLFGGDQNEPRRSQQSTSRSSFDSSTGY